MRKRDLPMICTSVLVVAVFASCFDIGKLTDTLGNVSGGHVLAAVLVVQAQIVLSALRWRFTAARLGQDMPLSIAVREYCIGSMLNLTLPGGVAGDIARIYRNNGPAEAASAVVLERLSGQLAFFIVTCLGLAVWPGPLPDFMRTEPSQLIVITTAILICLAACLLWFAIAGRLSFVVLRSKLKRVFWADGAFFVQAGLSVLIVASYVVTFLIASDAAGARLPAVAAITAIPLCLMSMLIPVGIGGWGTREAAASVLWPLFGFTALQGVASSVLYGLLCLFATALPCLLGAVIGRFRVGQFRGGR